MKKLSNIKQKHLEHKLDEEEYTVATVVKVIGEVNVIDFLAGEFTVNVKYKLKGKMIYLIELPFSNYYTAKSVVKGYQFKLRKKA